MSMTYTPSIGYDANGQEVPVFDNGTFENSIGREAVNAYRNDNEFADFYQDREGNVHHHFEDVEADEEAYYAEEVEDYYDSLPITAEDYADLTSIAGGTQQYQELVAWAYQNVDDEYIDRFDAVMDSGDYELIAEYIAGLTEYAQENGFDPTQLEFDEDEPESEDEEYYEPEPYSNDAVVEFAQANLDERDIAQLDYIFDYGTYEQQANAVAVLQQLYEQAYGGGYTSNAYDYYNEAPVAGSNYNYF